MSPKLVLMSLALICSLSSYFLVQSALADGKCQEPLPVGCCDNGPLKSCLLKVVAVVASVNPLAARVDGDMVAKELLAVVV